MHAVLRNKQSMKDLRYFSLDYNLQQKVTFSKHRDSNVTLVVPVRKSIYAFPLNMLGPKVKYKFMYAKIYFHFLLFLAVFVNMTYIMVRSYK